MTKAETLLALADRVEAATGPDRELDAEIAKLMGFRIVDEGHPIGRCCYDAKGGAIPLPAYTGSLDAAMTLLPIGKMNFLDIEMSWEPAQPDVHPAIAVRWYPPFKSGPDWHAFVVSAKTLPLALTAAALRALAASEKGVG